MTGDGVKTIYVGMGSNMGRRRLHLRAALRALEGEPLVELMATSSLYESAHLGDSAQAPHLNLCALLRSSLDPTSLLRRLQAIERAAGRRPDSHAEPRTLDMDLLLHGLSVSDDPRCRLPHPRMGHRRFVLEPLFELSPELRWPGQESSIRELLNTASIRRQELRRVADPGWWEEELAAWTA